MNMFLAFAGGVLVGFVLVKVTAPTESACCNIVANGARDKIAGLFGDASGVVGGFLDGSGITNALPGWLTAAGYKG